MVPSSASTHRPAFNPAARQLAAAAHATPAQALQLPPGLRALHVKEGLPRSVQQRLDERTPRPSVGQQRCAARALIDDHLGAGGGNSRGSALRV